MITPPSNNFSTSHIFLVMPYAVCNALRMTGSGKPKCKLCGREHWLHEPHEFGVVPFKDVGLDRGKNFSGKKSGKPRLKSATTDVLAQVEAGVGSRSSTEEQGPSKAGVVGSSPAGTATAEVSGRDSEYTIVKRDRKKQAEYMRKYRERKKI